MTSLVQLRRQLHGHPELAGQETRTAARVAEEWLACGPDELLEGLGGHGVAAVFRGPAEGPALLLRADLDALPIAEGGSRPHRSAIEGRSHACGHDGHLTALVGLARSLGRWRPASGRTILVAQPAEETGEGAARLLADSRFLALDPQLVYAAHNLPGRPLGEVTLRDGSFATASRGLRIGLTGATAHAAQPETGRSPAQAIARLVQEIPELPRLELVDGEAARATVIHVLVGEEAYGTAPGRGTVACTLRADDDAVLARLEARLRRLARAAAEAWALELEISVVEPFPACVNAPEACAALRRAADRAVLPRREAPAPQPWSEDFGHLLAWRPGALFGLGSGEAQPALHAPHYDFPDRLINRAVRLWRALVDGTLGAPA